MRLDPCIEVALADCEGALTDTLRLGHLWVLSAFAFDLPNWLELYAMTSPVLTGEAINTIVGMTDWLRRQNIPISKMEPWEYGLTYSVDATRHLPWEDIVSDVALRVFLVPYLGCRWRIARLPSCE